MLTVAADGYARSEGGVAFFLQKKEDALRTYGTLVDADHCFIGSSQQYFGELRSGAVVPFLKRIYSTNNIDPKRIMFVEAHGEASKVISIV